MLFQMRYRQTIQKVEYFSAALPFVTGLDKLRGVGIPHTLHDFSEHWSAYLLLVAPLLLLLRYFFCYTELTPSTLEHQALVRHRSIPYGELTKVIPPTAGTSLWAQNVITLEGIGMKPLKLVLDTPTDFIDDLLKHAPQARIMEKPLFA